MMTIIAIGIAAIATVGWFRRLRRTEDKGATALENISQATGVVFKISDAVLAVLEVLTFASKPRSLRIAPAPRPLGMQPAADVVD